VQHTKGTVQIKSPETTWESLQGKEI